MDSQAALADVAATGMAALAALRARGADHADPVRFRFIEAMARRAEAQQGAARRLLDARIAALLAVYGDAAEHADGAARASPDTAAAQPGAGEPSPLATLTAQLAAARRGHEPTPPGVAPSLVGPPDLPSADYFRSTWARLSAQRRLTESLARLPENAGPLNSHRLVHRALSLMRELSPGYLQRFMAHVDALMWLDQAQAGATAAAKDPPRARAGKKLRGKAG